MSPTPSSLPIGRTRDVLEFIRQYHAQHKYPPSIQEIGEYFHLRRRYVERHLTRLEAGRLLRWTPRKARGIDLMYSPSVNLEEDV